MGKPTNSTQMSLHPQVVIEPFKQWGIDFIGPINSPSKGKKNILFIGQNSTPESFFNNPQLYPQMFPHLFPYGYGGIQNPLHKGRMSSIKHKRWLLMYYDKRFQMDAMFPLIAFNMEQIKESSNGGYLLAQRNVLLIELIRLINKFLIIFLSV